MKCEHIESSDEGTHYCKLAEMRAKEHQELKDRVKELENSDWIDGKLIKLLEAKVTRLEGKLKVAEDTIEIYSDETKWTGSLRIVSAYNDCRLSENRDRFVNVSCSNGFELASSALKQLRGEGCVNLKLYLFYARVGCV